MRAFEVLLTTAINAIGCACRTSESTVEGWGTFYLRLYL